MKLVRVFAVLAPLAVAVVFVPGCSGDSPLDKDPKQVLAATSQAIQSPTGKISKTSMPNVITKAKQQGSASSAVSLTGLSGTTGLSSPAARPQGGNPLACMNGDSTQGSFDLGCLDPAFSGTIEFKTEIDRTGMYEMIALEGVCGGPAGECVDGYMALGVTSAPQGVEEFASIDVSGPVSAHVDFGFQERSSASGESVDVVAFDDAGDSYVLDADVTADTGSVTVRGSNGTWTCTYDSAGASGSCSGAGDTFTWS